ncbi:MAG: hypothetical protein R2804_19415 [Cyclobacteriaceae bacterium]
MKSVFSLFGWMVAFAAILLAFVYFYQKQQNEHEERMVANAANLVQIKHNTEIQLVQLNEQKTFGQKMYGAIKTLMTYAINIFT